MIWFNLLIPVLLLVLGYSFAHQKIAWFEGLISLVVTIIIIAVAKYSIETSMTNDTEYFQDYIVKAQYYERWDEEVPCTHSYDCMCSTDSDGNECCCSTCYHHAYDVDDHSPYWVITMSGGKTFRVSSSEYDRIVRKFEMKPQFLDMNRDYHSIDGDAYYTKFDGNFAKLDYATWEHTYENRVQASHTILNYDSVPNRLVKQYGIVDYPNVYNYYKSRSILGEISNLDEYNSKKNALLGNKKEVKVFYVIFKNQPIEAGLKQEQHWKKGNKNEVVICIGIDDKRKVQWSHSFSWTKENIVMVDIRTNIEAQKILNDSTFKEVIDYSHNTIDQKFNRRHFSEFSYLKVDPSISAMMWVMSICLIVNIGLFGWIIFNDIGVDDGFNTNRYRRRY